MSDNFAEILNLHGKRREPTFFVIDYACKEWIIEPLKELGSDILYSLEDSIENVTATNKKSRPLTFQKNPIPLNCYKASFDKIIDEIKSGNTYVLNLTCSTCISGEIDLREVYLASKAPFKLYVKDNFVCFSPECFIKIKDNTISTYPMKGTIDASIKEAEDKIMDDEKERAEHVMIVDLMRNDLAKVAKNIKVEKFRYIDKIEAGEKELLQVSSKISGSLDTLWHEKLGDILKSMLPAGSITGAPKSKTIDIIDKIESHKRGFFTGIFGVYDGISLNSAVMIRYIEKDKDGYIFKSGGGITLHSDLEKEYNEMREKVYIPVL